MTGNEPHIEGLVPKKRQLVRTQSLISGAKKEMLLPDALMAELNAAKAAAPSKEVAPKPRAPAAPDIAREARNDKPVEAEKVRPAANPKLRVMPTNLPTYTGLGTPTLLAAPPNVLVMENYLDAPTCKRFIDYIEKQAARDASMSNHPRRAFFCPVDKPTEALLGEVFFHAFSKVVEPHFNLEIEWWELPQPLRYAQGGKYDVHSDCEDWKIDDNGIGHWVKESDRDVSLLIYLNDDYEGGELEFADHKYRIKPKAGMLVAFPSHHGYQHAARPTTAGNRYVLVTWAGMAGVPRIRALHPRNVFMSQFRDTSPKREVLTRPLATTLNTVSQQPLPAHRDISPLAKPDPNLVRIWENVVDPRTCKRICDYIEKMHGREPKMPNHPRSAYHAPTTKEFENVSRALFYRMFSEYVEPFFGVSIDWWELPQPLRYAKGGKYDPHSDAERWVKPEDNRPGYWRKEQDRDISVLLYLNDAFKGGGLTFPDLKLHLQPKPGMLVAFPSHSGYKHGADPTEDGLRYAMVTWASVRGVPKIKDAHSRAIYMNEFWKE